MAKLKNSVKRLFSNRTKTVNRSKSGNAVIFIFIIDVYTIEHLYFEYVKRALINYKSL